MSTTETPTLPARTRGAAGEDRIILRGIDWSTYLRLCEAKRDQHVLVAYDRGVLELMSPGTFHERSKRLIAQFIEAVARALLIPYVAMGSSLWNDAESERGLEPDDCFYFNPEKIAASFQRSNRSADYPPPDMAIEIDLRSGAFDRARIYASLAVSEVWRFDGQTVRIDRLREDGAYEPAVESQFLPVRADEVVSWIERGNASDHMTWAGEVAVWAQQELAPRRAGGHST